MRVLGSIVSLVDCKSYPFALEDFLLGLSQDIDTWLSVTICSSESCCCVFFSVFFIFTTCEINKWQLGFCQRKFKDKAIRRISSFFCKIIMFSTFLVLKYQVYTLNKSDIFHRLYTVYQKCYFHGEKITSNWDVSFVLQTKCNEQKIKCFDIKYGIHFTCETVFCNIFNCALHL